MTNEVAAQQEVILKTFRSLLGDQRGCYVAIPITSGPRYYRWAQETGIRERNGPEVWDRLLQEVILPNIEHSRPVVSRLRAQLSAPLINPAELELLEGWSQDDFYTLWMRVFDSFVGRLILLDGWEFSVGCCIEAAKAAENELPIIDEHLRPVATGDLVFKMQASVEYLTVNGFSADRIRSCLDRVVALKRGE